MSIKKPDINNWLVMIVGPIICSAFLMLFIFPDRLWFHHVSFIRNLDLEFCYEGVFTLLYNFYHGGIQLWDVYDQMPLAYHHLGGGLYTFTNVAPAFVYVVLSPLFQSSADAFQVIYSVAFVLLPFFLRTAGAFLIARHFSRSIPVVFAVCVLFNTTLVPQLHMGLSAGDCYSYFPLVMFFILRFFENFKLNDFLGGLLIFVIAIASNPLVGPGYFYQGLHFLILSCAVWALIFNREVFFIFVKKIPTHLKALAQGKENNTLFKIGLVGLLAFIILAPSLHMTLFNWHDYEFDVEHSRFNSVFNIGAYFDRPVFFAKQSEFLKRWLDYNHNDWGNTWLFFGYVPLFLVVAGILMSRDDRRFIFLLTLFFFWLINSPRHSSGLSGLAHWLNALTNPLKFLPRSFHMVGAFMSSFILLPLTTIGLQSVEDTIKDAVNPRSRLNIVLTAGVLGLIVIMLLGKFELEIKQYLLRAFLISIVILYFLWQKPWGRIVSGSAAAFLLGVIFLMDCYGSYRYIKQFADAVVMTQYQLKGLESSGSVNLDYRNPKILPRRFYFTIRPLGSVPYYLSLDPAGMQGLYFQFTDFLKYFLPIDNYKPRHIAYAKWPGTSRKNTAYTYDQWPVDQDMLNYLLKDQNLLFFAETAVSPRKDIYREILDHHMERQVAVIEPLASDSDAVISDHLPENVEPPKPKNIIMKWQQIPLAGAASTKEDYNFIEYIFPLPKDFPNYLASTVFSDDRILTRVLLGPKRSIELTPAQGKLIRPFTFDVQNMQKGKFSILLPKGFAADTEPVTLVYMVDNTGGIGKVWKNEPDNFGFDYTASKNGWLVIHYPYDSKWRMTVDDRPVQIYRANKSFMGVPLERGKHRILLRYWPSTILRPLIVFSFGTMILTLLGVIAIGIHEENLYARN